MLATPELLQEAAQPHSLAETLARSLRQVPLYGRGERITHDAQSGLVAKDLRRWPLITKEDIRRGFPANFLGAGVELEELLEQDVVELEHTSGTSEERTPLLLPRGWWAEQELRALQL